MAKMMTSDAHKVGVMFVQLGTPDAPTPAAVRRYLAEFLSDRRIVDMPRHLWLPLLHGFILRTRPRRVAASYRRIWRTDGLSPLRHHTRHQVQAVAHLFQGTPILVRYAMRYGTPSIATTLDGMINAGVRRLLIFPLFPQYAAATHASILDAIQAATVRHRFVPTLRFAEPFFANPHYIQALATHVRTHARPPSPETHYLFSFHGLPQRHVDEGDPYADHCHRTAQLLAQTLALPEKRWQMAFQSRFGREAWLTPATGHTLTHLPQRGCRHLTVVCPGFLADCLETLEEIQIVEKRRFTEAGGKTFHALPCFNDAPVWTEALARLTREALSDWIA